LRCSLPLFQSFVRNGVVPSSGVTSFPLLTSLPHHVFEPAVFLRFIQEARFLLQLPSCPPSVESSFPNPLFRDPTIFPQDHISFFPSFFFFRDTLSPPPLFSRAYPPLCHFPTLTWSLPGFTPGYPLSFFPFLVHFPCKRFFCHFFSPFGTKTFLFLSSLTTPWFSRKSGFFSKPPFLFTHELPPPCGILTSSVFASLFSLPENAPSYFSSIFFLWGLLVICLAVFPAHLARLSKFFFGWDTSVSSLAITTRKCAFPF